MSSRNDILRGRRHRSPLYRSKSAEQPGDAARRARLAPAGRRVRAAQEAPLRSSPRGTSEPWRAVVRRLPPPRDQLPTIEPRGPRWPAPLQIADPHRQSASLPRRAPLRPASSPGDTWLASEEQRTPPGGHTLAIPRDVAGGRR
jgi:hypothetical protein